MTHVTLPKRFQQISGLADDLNNDSPLSPWRNVDGWDLSTCYHDPMHVLFLGTCRDLYGSALGYWLRNGFYGEGSMNEKLRAFSCDLKEHSRAAGSLVDDLLLLFFYVFSMGWCNAQDEGVIQNLHCEQLWSGKNNRLSWTWVCL